MTTLPPRDLEAPQIEWALASVLNGEADQAEDARQISTRCGASGEFCASL